MIIDTVSLVIRLPNMSIAVTRHGRINQLKARSFIIVVLVVFVILKLPHLYYPFFFDESYPYAKAIHEMYEYGPSLYPSVINEEYSKGHPLLFHFLAASWMKIFGDSNFAMHSFSLFISVLLIISIFEIVKKLFNTRAAQICVLLLLSQVAFFVHSSFLLPEVMVTLWILLSIYFYASERYLLLFLSLSALFFTKETGFVLGVILGADAVINLFNRTTSLKNRITKVAVLLLSLLPIGLFFYLQYRAKGWIFYPGHTGLFKNVWGIFWSQFIGTLKILFVEGLHYYLFIFMLLIAAIYAILKRKPIFLFLLAIPIALCPIVIADIFPEYSRLLFFVFVISFLLPGYFFAHSNHKCKENQAARKFIILSVTLAIGYIAFTATNFFTSRYLIPVIVMMLIPTGIIVTLLLDQIHAKAFYFSLPLILLLGAWSYRNDSGYGDIDLGVFDAMDVQQEMINYLETHNYYNQKISSNSFLQRIHLTDPQTGFLKSHNIFTDVQWNFVKSTDIAVFDNIEPDYQREWVMNDTNFRLVYKIERGEVWGEIYMKK